MTIRAAIFENLEILAGLARQLWPQHTMEALQEEFLPLLAREDAVFFLAYDRETAVGFAQCQLRQDYVQGTSGAPVGYLEGIFVQPSHRRRGYARALVTACEAWATARGCREFASDCELANVESYRFHRAIGFQEAGRIICFVKRL